MDDPDIVVIGGGVAGGAMATVMARAGYGVVMLEVTREHRDVVRGEALTPWGAAEAQALGLYDLYMSSGGHHATQFTAYDEDLDPAQAEARSLDLTTLPFPPLLCIGHPKACNMLNGAAVTAGARFVRGVRHTRVTPGPRPTVAFELDGSAHELRPRLVVGADGRHGHTRIQAGVEEQADPVHHWMAGLLVEGAHGWPAHRSAVGVEGWRNLFVFPQGEGRLRVYLCVGTEDRERVMGPDAARNILEAFRLRSVPQAAAIAEARPAGEVFSYPNNDTWTLEPFTPGVVLIGDAAGRNDPIIGQGLAMSLRDVKLVSTILKDGADWSPGAFRPYGEERFERFRRMRNIGRFAATRDAEFGEAPRNRRRRVAERLAANPELMASMLAPFVGPDALPRSAYEMETISAILA
jgi:2-polyprenyl-6-methoxyphenol hydroxylase-like FAD-dependent oxidoreductase